MGYFREEPLNEKSTLRYPCPRAGEEHLRELQVDDRIYRKRAHYANGGAGNCTKILPPLPPPTPLACPLSPSPFTLYLWPRLTLPHCKVHPNRHHCHVIGVISLSLALLTLAHLRSLGQP